MMLVNLTALDEITNVGFGGNIDEFILFSHFSLNNTHFNTLNKFEDEVIVIQSRGDA